VTAGDSHAAAGASPRADAAGSPRRGRGRRPAAEVRADIVGAAGAVLFDEGMAGFTIERVAEVAGASKTTIYKWWPSKGALALDGYFHRVEETLAFPDTGDIGADLLAQLEAFVDLLANTPSGRVIAELIGRAQTDPELKAALNDRYTAPRQRLAREAIQRAQARGELRADFDPEVAAHQLWGACYHRMLMTDLPLSPSFAESLVSNLIRGLAPDCDARARRPARRP
jgi:AcrR family transcriptional regulator